MKYRTRHSAFYLTIFVLAATLLFTSCEPDEPEETVITAEESSEDASISVTAMELAPGTIRQTIHINGEIQPVSSVDVFAETSGELQSITISKGDRVSRNDVIGKIDPSRAGQRFAASPIRAPISGTVVMVSPRVGSQISPQTPVARIATTGELEIISNISDRHLAHLDTGRRATVKLDAFPTEEFAARIQRLAPTIDTQTRTIETVLQFEQSDRRIRPGMFADVRIILDERTAAFTVPQDALIRRDGATYVYVIDEESSAQLRPITVGIEADGQAELREGVSAGERIIIRGQNLVESGIQVRIIEEQ